MKAHKIVVCYGEYPCPEGVVVLKNPFIAGDPENGEYLMIAPGCSNRLVVHQFSGNRDEAIRSNPQ